MWLIQCRRLTVRFERCEVDLAAVKDGYGAPALFDAAFDRATLLLRLLYAYPTLATHHRRGNAARVSDLQARIRQLRTALGD